MQRPSSSLTGSAQVSVPFQEQHKKHIPSFEELDEHCEQRPHSYQPSTEAPSAAAQSSVRARASEGSGSISSLSDNGSADNIENNNDNNDTDSAVSSDSSQFKEENDRYFSKGELALIPTECFSKQVSGQQQQIHESDLEAQSEEKEENKRDFSNKIKNMQKIEVQQFKAEVIAGNEETDQPTESMDQQIKRRIDRVNDQESIGREFHREDGDFQDGEALKNITDAQLNYPSDVNCLSDYRKDLSQGNQEQIVQNQVFLRAPNSSQARIKTDPSILRDFGEIDFNKHDRGGISERQASQTYSKANNDLIYIQQQQQQQGQEKSLEETNNEINRRQLQILELEKQKVQKLLLDKQRRLRLHEIQQQSQQQPQILQVQINQPQHQDHIHEQQQIDANLLRKNKHNSNNKNNNNSSKNNLLNRESTDQERVNYMDEELNMIKDENKKLSKKLQILQSEYKQISEELELDNNIPMYPFEQSGEFLKKIKALKAASKQDKKFITCILDMVESCTSPSQGNNNTQKSKNSLDSSPGSVNEYGNKLKTAWKWLKFIMEDYVAMKRANKSDKPTKNSNMYKSCLLENNSKVENIPGATTTNNAGNGTNGQSSKSDAIVIAEINGMIGTDNKYDMLRAIKEIIRQNQLLQNHINGNNQLENTNIPQQFTGHQYHSQSSSRLSTTPMAQTANPIIPSVPLHHATIFSPCSSATQLQRHQQQQQSSQQNQLQQQYLPSKVNTLNQSPAPSLDSQQYIQQKLLSGNVSPQKTTQNIVPPNSQNEIPSIGCQVGMFRQNSQKIPSNIQQQQLNFIQQQQQQQQSRQLQLSPPPKQVMTQTGIANSGSTGNTRVNTVHLSPRSSVQNKQNNQKEGLPIGGGVSNIISTSQQQQQQHQQYLNTFQQPGNYFPNPYLQFGQK